MKLNRRERYIVAEIRQMLSYVGENKTRPSQVPDWLSVAELEIAATILAKAIKEGKI